MANPYTEAIFEHLKGLGGAARTGMQTGVQEALRQDRAVNEEEARRSWETFKQLKQQQDKQYRPTALYTPEGELVTEYPGVAKILPREKKEKPIDINKTIKTIDDELTRLNERLPANFVKLYSDIKAGNQYAGPEFLKLFRKLTPRQEKQAKQYFDLEDKKESLLSTIITPTQPTPTEIPEGVTEEDIQFTMDKYEMSREGVLSKMQR